MVAERLLALSHEVIMHSPLVHIEARAKRRAAALFFSLSLGFWIVSAFSRATENARVGVVTDWHVPWALEGSSLLTSALLFFFVWAVEARWPLEPGRPLQKIVAHVTGAVVFSALHIVSMVAIREVYWLLIFQDEYNYLRSPLQDILYDFRKDGVTYGTILMIIYLSRNLEIAHAERLETRSDATSKRRIVLKCGGRTEFIEAQEIEAVQADGNYIRVYSGDNSHHARMSLAECLELLHSAGVKAHRVHKSWLLNADDIVKIEKTTKGDPQYTMRSGRNVRGSRRYPITSSE